MKTINIIILLSLVVIIGCDVNSKTVYPSGTFEAVEVDIAATILGRVSVVHPGLGDYVNIGDTLLVLDGELISLQRDQTAVTKQAISAQRKVANDVIQQSERNLEWIVSSLERAEQLIKQGSATQQQIDDLTAKRDIAIKQLESAKHQLGILDAEESKLYATLKVFNRQLQECVITSPINGTVILRNAEPGEILTPGEVALRLADTKLLELKVFLEAGDLDKIKLGLDVGIKVDALEHETLQGKVTWVSSEAEFTPKNAQTKDARAKLVFAIKIAVENTEGRLHIGMPAEVVL